MTQLEASGPIQAARIRVRGDLRLNGAKLRNDGSLALDLSAATLDALYLSPSTEVRGSIDFSFTTIRILSVGATGSAAKLPRLSSADGWTLGTVDGFLRKDRRSASAWLDTLDDYGPRKEFTSQPWKEMAKIYDHAGQPEDARWLRFSAAHRTTRVAPWQSKLVRWPYGALVGYGYYPLLVLCWLAALWVAVFVLCFLHSEAFMPTDFRYSTAISSTGSEEIRVTGATDQPEGYPAFSPALFATDTSIPAGVTGQTVAWRVTGNSWLPGVFSAIKGFAWLLAALLVAGVTGILRKD